MNRVIPWMAAAIAMTLAACGGGSGGGSSVAATTGSSSSASTASSVSSSLASSASSSVVSSSSSVSSSVASSSSSSVTSSSSSSVVSSSSSSAASVSAYVPANGETNTHYDTRLSITFDAAPTLGTSGYIKVYKTSDDSLVNTISLNVFNTGSTIYSSYTASSLQANDVQTVIPRNNTEIDKLGNVAMLTQYRWMFYKPVSISGKTATIRLHDNMLSPATGYYVTVDNGVLTGNVGGSAFSGISSKTAWAFTTRSAPSSKTAVTVDDTGTAADFRTVQGALNWVMNQCGGASTDACNSVSVAKTITISDGTYTGDLFIRNISNLTIAGTSRSGVVVQSENFEQYNPGTGGSGATPTTTVVAETGGNRPRLNGGRALLLVEGADLLKLTNFTLQNTHVKNVWEGVTATMNNQAETIYFNGATLSGSRLIGTQMNFFSTQDTIQVKGWVWIYQSLIKGDVDYVWGSPFAMLIEDSELRTIVDTTSASNGGYVIESRTAYGYPGFVVLNSQLTKEAGVPVGATYLGRQASNFSSGYCSAQWTGTGTLSGNTYFGCNNVAFINNKMDTHIIAAGWLASNTPPITTPTASAGYRESGSKDLTGNTIDTSARSSYSTTAADLSGLDTRTEVFLQWNSNAGWVPTP
ncbi:MAG: Ig-like domain-containing protein [Rhodocyclaceae bacterium]